MTPSRHHQLSVPALLLLKRRVQWLKFARVLHLLTLTSALNGLLVFFSSWMKERNMRCGEDDQCPIDLLEKPNGERLNHWLSRFVVEARRGDGKQYPPATLASMLAGLYRYTKKFDPSAPNFMNKKDGTFKDLYGALQVRYRELRQAGIGADVKHSPIVTKEEEDTLWTTGVLGDEDPVALQRAVFFYVGKVFCIRGGEEQRSLKQSQFARSHDPDCYTYIENGSKNKSGVNLKQPNKIVPVYAVPDSRPRCLVYLLDKYLSKIPQRGKELDIFYLRPSSSFNKNPAGYWYECAAIGRDKLRRFLSDMCEAAGIKEKKTNHSLRSTGATAMFSANVPEKLIRDVTGHQSNALHLYERPTMCQKQELSKVLVQGKENFDANNASCIGAPKIPAANTPSNSLVLFSVVSINVTSLYHHKTLLYRLDLSRIFLELTWKNLNSAR